MKGYFRVFGLITGFFLAGFGCTESSNDPKKDAALKEKQELMAGEPGFTFPHTVNQAPAIIPLSPEESLKSFRLPQGYHLELVASEPMISEPVAITWDGNGRMYVAQMETFMQTIDAKGENEPMSRIMLLEDTDNDGQMDKSSVFIDKLVTPRMLLCVGNELLVNETNTFNIYAYKDSDGDGKADQKRAVFQTDKKSYGNVEHQRSGLDWNLDNRIYVTTDPVRYRYRNGQLQADSLPYGNNGQWGLTHDNYGRLFYSRAASGIAACGFQINPAYGQLDLPDKEEDSLFAVTWPIIKTPDINSGPANLRSDSTLATFTAVCGQSVFRGDRLPASMVGDYLVAEPAGRFIRRARITQKEGTVRLKNLYDHDEFITSTDMNFRPVNTYTGPDGCVYIVDMYRGIIQESAWVQPGSFLYDQIMSKGLNRNSKNGRIYRLVHDGFTRGPQPGMLKETTAKLVSYLHHPNGWWRDNAQKEIIVRNDRSAIPALKKMALGEKTIHTEKNNVLGRIHALWTLEGLDAVDKDVLFKAIEDNDAQVRKAGIRMSEPYLVKNDSQVIQKLESIKDDKNPEVLGQLVLSLNYSNTGRARGIIHDILSKNMGNELLSGIQATMKKNEEIKTYGARLVNLKEPDRKRVLNGAVIFQSFCAACHGVEGRGLPTKVAPPLIGKFKLLEQKEGVIKILLHGLKGPVDGAVYADQMPAMGANNDEWIASVLNYLRYDLCMKSFPNMSEGYIDHFVLVQPEQVGKVRKRFAGRDRPWTWEEIKFEH